MTDQNTPGSDKSLDEVLAMLKKQRVAMLTSSEDDQLVSRPMAVLEMDDDNALWFIVDAHSDKADQVRADGRINLAFAADDYLSVSGTAEVLHDPKRAQELWSPHVKAWMQCEPTDEKVGLLKVSPTSIAWWDTPSTPGYLVRLVKGIVSDEKPGGSDSGVVEL